jgi:apolipoprotein N-acyltransferase
MVLVYGLSARFGSTPLSMSMAIPMLFKHFDDCLYGSSNGLIYSFSNMAVPSLFPETPLTFAPLWVLFEWAKTWVFTGFPWLFAGYAFTERLLDGYAPLFGVYAVSFVVIVLHVLLSKF